MCAASYELSADLAFFLRIESLSIIIHHRVTVLEQHLSIYPDKFPDGRLNSHIFSIRLAPLCPLNLAVGKTTLKHTAQRKEFVKRVRAGGACPRGIEEQETGSTEQRPQDPR